VHLRDSQSWNCSGVHDPSSQGRVQLETRLRPVLQVIRSVPEVLYQPAYQEMGIRHHPRQGTRSPDTSTASGLRCGHWRKELGRALRCPPQPRATSIAQRGRRKKCGMGITFCGKAVAVSGWTKRGESCWREGCLCVCKTAIPRFPDSQIPRFPDSQIPSPGSSLDWAHEIIVPGVRSRRMPDE
jgi:hypothetical protein